MKKSIACLLACTGLFSTVSAQIAESGSRISLLNGINSFANSASKDSVYFLKGGINLGIQGNYFWRSLGIAGRVGYFSNNANEDKLADFGLSRKASEERMLIATKPYKGFYWMAGPAFQTRFSRWQVESNILGGMVHHDESGVFIGDRATPDIVYYRNKMDAGSSFAWNVGLGLNYSISAPMQLGISADYLSTQSDVTNTDINRNGGTVQQSLTSQANFISTALKLTYSLSHNRYENRDAGRKSVVKNNNSKPAKNYFAKSENASPAKQSTDCDCENKLVDIARLEPLTIDVTFNTLAEAQSFLKSGSNPLYEQQGNAGSNPMYTKREAGSGMATGRRQYKPVVANFDDETNTVELNGKYYAPSTREAGSGMATGRRQHEPLKSSAIGSEDETARGMMVRTSSGEQVFALLPVTVNLAELSYLEGGAISVHVKNDKENGARLKAQNNNTVRSNRTDNTLVSNNNLDSTGGPVLKVADHNSSRSNKSSSITENPGGGDNDDELLDVILYTDAAGKTSAKIFPNKLKNFFEKGDRPVEDQYTTREAGSGLATGRRMHKPMTVLFDEENNEIDINGTTYREVTAREAGSGMATGKRTHKPTIPIRLVAGDEATAKAIITNNTTRGGSATLNSQTSATRQTQGASFGEKLVAGDPIPGLDVILKRANGMAINTTTDENGFIQADNIVAGEYEIQQVYKGKWQHAAVAVKISCAEPGKDGTASQVILKADTDGDGVAEKEVRHVHGDPHVDEKDGTRAMNAGSGVEYQLGNIKPVRCENGRCSMKCTVTINGRRYDADVTLVLKTRHDTVKNSIGNIR